MTKVTIELQAIVLLETPKALRIEPVDGPAEGKAIWLPRSQITWEYSRDENRRDQIVTVTIPEWLAIEKGFV